MANRVMLTIDGRTVEVPEEMNLLDAAKIAGVHIPNLCYLEGMKGIGACRLCLVEVEGLKGPVIACNTRVKDGMVVMTQSERVEHVRKFVIDLLLSMHPLDCMTCTKAGACNLQQYAYEFGLKESSFRRKRFGYPTDEANPFIKRDPEYCVLCGRCVRVCKEQGTHVLDFMGRGIESKVVTAGDRPLQESGCTFCGSCVDVCPVNALLEADRWRKGREWQFERIPSVCLLCGNSCDIQVSVKDGAIQRITSGGDGGSVERYICAYGRFGFESIASHARVSSPMVREDGALRETTWEDAFAVIAARLKGAGRKVGVICSAGVPNEDALALKQFADQVLKTQDVDSTVSLYGDAKHFIGSQTAHIDRADLFVLVDVCPSQWQRVLPALDASLRRRVARGSRLVVISESGCRIAEDATVRLEGNVISIVKRLANALLAEGLNAGAQLRKWVRQAEWTEDIARAAKLIAEARNPLILTSPAYFTAAANIALMKGKIVAVPLESNARGVSLMGFRPVGKSSVDMLRGESETLYIVGDIPASGRPNTKFLIVQGAYLTGLAEHADVLLPSCSYLETSGTIVDFLGRVRNVRSCVKAYRHAMRHRDILTGLARSMGVVLPMPSPAEVKRRARARMKLRPQPFDAERFPVASGDYAAFLETLLAPVVNGSRLVWLAESKRGADG